jgi:hypothetical protein
MNIESGPVVNLEQRRLTPIIKNALASLVVQQPYFIDPGFYTGFSGDEPQIVALEHSFLDPTTTIFTVKAIHQNGEETMISPDLATSIANAINKNFSKADVSYKTSPNPEDTTVNTNFTISRTN